jgi:hypothetical protein
MKTSGMAQTALFISSLAFGGILFYIAVYNPVVRKRKIDLRRWEQEAPRTIQAATVCGIVMFGSLSTLLWQTFGIGSPGVVLILLLGFISLMTVF